MSATLPPLHVIAAEIAALQDQFARLESDIEFGSRGGEIFYGIDNDAITAITAPWSDTSSTFGPLFTDLPTAAQAFATIFAEYVQNTSRRVPFLLIPPGHNELEGIWNEVYLNAADAYAHVDRHFSKLLANPDPLRIPKEGDEAQLFDSVSRAVKIIYGGESPVTELRRINRLAQSGAIRRLDSYVNEEGYSPFKFPEGDEASRYEEKHHKWQRLLNVSRKERPASNANDAAVLAFVEYSNEVFVENKEQRKLCYVTGDSHIYRVAAEVSAPVDTNFSQAVLRRPTAFLADSQFFVGAGLPHPNLKVTNGAGSPNSVVSVVDWLREIFAISIDRRLALSKQQLPPFIGAIRDAREKWGDYLKSTSAGLSISQEEISSITEYHRKAATYLHRPEVMQEFEGLRRRLEVVTTEAKLGFGVAGALSRFWSMRPQVSQGALRGIPRVRFDSFSVANKLAGTLAGKNGLLETQIELRKRGLAQLQAEDGSGYTRMIIFALGFASVSEWTTALKVAELAYAIAQTQRALRAKTTVKGDEAAYLCGVFSRLIATSIADLSTSSEWLERAEALRRTPPLRRDVDRHRERADDRFVAERLAVRLTRSLMRRFAPNETDSAMTRTLVEAFDSFENLLEIHTEELRFLSARGVYSNRDYHAVQLLMNALQCLILADKRTRQSPQANELRNYLEGLIGCDVRDATLDTLTILSDALNSRFVLFVILASLLIVFSGQITRSRRAEFLAKLQELCPEQVLFPYDSARADSFLSEAQHKD